MIPTYLTRFVGREGTLADLEERLVSGRLLTLTGPSGVGKTRLAVELANRLRQATTHPLYWVDLAPFDQDDSLLPAIARTVGLYTQSGQSELEALSHYLGDEAFWLVLDNCEHLIVACATVATTLLKHCPMVQIVATSRQPLRVAGELRYPVSPLSLPQKDEPGRSEAVTLFVDRATALLPHFHLAEQNETAVAHICRRLDGLPLAIELAAARINILTVQQIGEQLDDRFELLQSQTLTTVSARYHTLQAAITDSYELLSPQAQILLRRLAVFEDGCTLDAVTEVCADPLLPATSVLERLTELVNHSLLETETIRYDEARYRLLETIHAYARERLLGAATEEAHLRDKHLTYFTDKVEKIEPHLYEAAQQRWFDWLDRELNNMRRALRWSLKHDPSPSSVNDYRVTAGVRLALALGQYWIQRHYLAEGQRWLEVLVDTASERVALGLRARAAIFATFCAGLRLDADRAQRLGERAVSLAEASNDDRLRCLAYGAYSLHFSAIGDNAHAYQWVKKSLALARQTNDLFNTGMGLFNLAIQATALAKFDEAQSLLDESLTNATGMGDPFRVGQTLIVLGDLRRIQRRWLSARIAYEEAIDAFDQVGDMRNAATARHNLAHVALQEGQLAEATVLLETSVQMQQALGDYDGMIQTLLGYGALAVAVEARETAVALLTAFTSLSKRPVISLYPATQRAYHITMETATAQLSDHALAAAQREGRQLTLRDAFQIGRSLTLPSSVPTGRLTPRQREVVALVATGASNSEIAEILVLSKRTVEKHVGNILARLELNNRAEIVRWGIEQGITS